MVGVLEEKSRKDHNDTYYYKNNDGILQVDSDFYDVLNRNFILQLKARRTG